MKLIGKLISKLYWKYGRKYDDNSFWMKVVVYYIGAVKVDGTVIIAQINEKIEESIKENILFVGQGTRLGKEVEIHLGEDK